MKRILLAVILLLSMSAMLFAQVRISGVVSDSAGPMVGASVVEKGSANIPDALVLDKWLGQQRHHDRP